MNALPVLYEDNHLLVVNKPAGIATMGATSGTATVVTLAGSYLKQRYQKPGNVFVGVVSRLDRLVSGVLVLARTSKSASRLSEQFREQRIQKSYIAWVEGRLQTGAKELELCDWLIKDESQRRMRSTAENAQGSQLARLRVRTRLLRPTRAQVAIELLTGRKHQIRVQLSERGHPILGDRKYGAKSSFPHGIALHCHQLTIHHPTRKEAMTFEAPLPDYWPGD